MANIVEKAHTIDAKFELLTHQVALMSRERGANARALVSMRRELESLFEEREAMSAEVFKEWSKLKAKASARPLVASQLCHGTRRHFSVCVMSKARQGSFEFPPSRLLSVLSRHERPDYVGPLEPVAGLMAEGWLA